MSSTFLGVQVNLHGRVATGVEYFTSVDLQDRHGSGSADETIRLSGSTGWTLRPLLQLLLYSWLMNRSGKKYDKSSIMQTSNVFTAVPERTVSLGKESVQVDLRKGWRIYNVYTQRKAWLMHNNIWTKERGSTLSTYTPELQNALKSKLRILSANGQLRIPDCTGHK